MITGGGSDHGRAGRGGKLSGAQMTVKTEPVLLWTPSQESVERATITRYARWLGETRGLEFADYHDLWRWSVDDLEAFWASIWDFFEVEASTPYERVLGRREMPGTE